MNILITGGTGFIGEELRPFLMKEGHHLCIISRSPEKHEDESAKNQRFISWDSDLAKEMNWADAVIHLAGENLFGKRWTDEVKQRIRDSRIKTTQKLVDAISLAGKKPEVFVSVSGSSIYGDRGDEILDENASVADDFLADVCKQWELTSDKASEFGVRVANPRFGIVLEKGGGALKQMIPPYYFFVGGPLGSGKQYLSWIHRTDVCRAILHLIENKNCSGPFNFSTPNPETMDEFSETIGETLNRPSVFKVPAFVLKLVLGEASKPPLDSIRMQPKKMLESGFEFKYKELDEALAEIL